jgi:hypothetical protein
MSNAASSAAALTAAMIRKMCWVAVVTPCR